MNLSWEMLFGLGALALFVALVYGLWQSRRRNRSNDPLTEAATREEYDRPDSYRRRRPDFQDKVRPS